MTNINNRNSVFELLRLVLMLMIVIHHGIVHGLGISSLGFADSTHYHMSTNTIGNLPFFLMINSFLIVSVNCFILISGYFGMKLTWRKIITILLAVFFYKITFTSIWYVINGNYYAAIRSLFVLSHGEYWFITDYVFLMLIAPLLNSLFRDFNFQYVITFILTLIILSCYFGFMWGHQANQNGYTLIQFIMMYCIGRTIRYRKINISRTVSLSLFLCCSIVTGMLSIYFIKGGNGSLAWKMTYYNNPLIIVSSVALFIFFSQFHVQSKIINYFAKSALAVYLFQCSKSISIIYNQSINDVSQKIANGGGIMLIIINLALIVYCIALTIDILQRFLNNKILYALENRYPNITKQVDEY